MEKVKLTEKEQKVLEAYIKLFGLRPPTQIELSKYLGLSRQSVQLHLKKLKEKGLLTKKGYPVVTITNLKELI